MSDDAQPMISRTRSNCKQNLKKVLSDFQLYNKRQNKYEHVMFQSKKNFDKASMKT